MATKKIATTTTTTTTTAKPKKAAPLPDPLIAAKAPAFSLVGDDGETHSLAALKGKPVVLYFYPRDDTPGCTTEACDFRDNMAHVTKEGAVVFGVSRDHIKSHARFKAKHELNFTLLADEELVAHRAYGAWGTKLMYGKEVEGTIRSTFLIDGDGVIRRSWRKVKVAGHVDAVLAALKEL